MDLEELNSCFWVWNPITITENRKKEINDLLNRTVRNAKDDENRNLIIKKLIDNGDFILEELYETDNFIMRDYCRWVEEEIFAINEEFFNRMDKDDWEYRVTHRKGRFIFRFSYRWEVDIETDLYFDFAIDSVLDDKTFERLINKAYDEACSESAYYPTNKAKEGFTLLCKNIISYQTNQS